MSLRSGAVDYQAPLLRHSEERSARWWLVGQGGAVYRFERPARARHLRSRMLYLACGLLVLLAAAFIASSVFYVRDWLQSLFLLLALTG